MTFFTCQCASCHNGVRVLDIWMTSGPPKVLRTCGNFNIMCFAPQRCALFRHRNFRKRSGPEVFCTCSLRNMLRATTLCTFSASQLPKVVRTRQLLTFSTSERASRRNGMHFFDIPTSKSGPRMLCFATFDLQMCFAPSRRALFHLSSGQLAPHPPL